jgi:hypothetical protein
MFKLSALVLAIAAVSATGAMAAAAQSFDPDLGTGNIVQFNSAPVAQPHERVVVRRGGRDQIAARAAGLHAFATVPGAAVGGPARSIYDPALTGGGSLGYNEAQSIQ